MSRPDPAHTQHAPRDEHLVTNETSPRLAGSPQDETRPGLTMDVATVAVLVTGLLLIGLVIWSWLNGGIVAVALSTRLTSAEKLERVRDYFLQFGVFAPIVYVVFVVIEVVVAPLPGLMLYAPGGIVFGGLYGGFLSLIGNVLGAGLSCFAMRTLGGRFVNRLMEGSELQPVADRLVSRGVLVVALLRVNPLTSSDLVSYAAGLTQISIWRLMLGTAIGMAPLCWAQACLANNILESFPQLLLPLMLLCGVYVVIALWVLRRTMRELPRQHVESLNGQ